MGLIDLSYRAIVNLECDPGLGKGFANVVRLVERMCGAVSDYSSTVCIPAFRRVSILPTPGTKNLSVAPHVPTMSAVFPSERTFPRLRKYKSARIAAVG